MVPNPVAGLWSTIHAQPVVPVDRRVGAWGRNARLAVLAVGADDEINPVIVVADLKRAVRSFSYHRTGVLHTHSAGSCSVNQPRS